MQIDILTELKTLANDGQNRADGTIFISYRQWYCFFGRRCNLTKKAAGKLGFQLQEQGLVEFSARHGWLIRPEQLLEVKA